MVGGLPLPLTPEQMAAAGVSPEQAPGGIPMPSMANPYGGLPSNAVAGPGGAPSLTLDQIEDLQAKGVYTPEQANQAKIANGAFQSAPSAPDVGGGHSVEQIDRWAAQGALTPEAATAMKAQAGIAHGDTAAERALPMATPPMSAAGAKAASAPPAPGSQGAEPIKLIPTIASAQADVSSAAEAADKAQQQRIFDATFKGGLGGGKAPSLGVTGETIKSTEYGTIPEELTKDIAARQEAVDKTQAAEYGAIAQANAADLGRQQQVIAEQQRDAAVAAQRQQLVSQRIATLQSKSDADEAALVQAKPKQLNEYWGGSAAAQILSAISVALGAGVQTRTGHNPAQEILDKSIDRWVNDQVQQYNVAKDKATVSNNKYKDALAVYGTPEAAEAQIRLQAITAKNAMAQNMAEQSKNTLWLANAQAMQQKDQLERQKQRAASIQQAGMKEVEQKLSLRGGTGSVADRELLALRKQAEAKKLQDEIGGRTNDDIKTNVEVEKAQAGSGGVAKAAQEAAASAERFRAKAATLSARATPEGKGEIEAAKEDAKGAYAAYLIASKRASSKGARAAADAFYDGKGDAIRGPSADHALAAHIKTLRGNAVRAHGAAAAGIDPQLESTEEGELE